MWLSHLNLNPPLPSLPLSFQNIPEFNLGRLILIL